MPVDAVADPRTVRGPRPSRAWVRVGRGLYRSEDPSAFLADLRAWQALLPGESCFTHVTAARAHQLWLPRLPAGAPVFACISREQDRLRRPEIRTFRQTSPVPHLLVDGVRIAPACEAILVSARDLAVVDLLVLIDGALQAGACRTEELDALSRTRRWGARGLRRALPLVDARSESPWETVLRLFHQGAGVPVEPQVDVLDADGRFVARADLVVRGRRWVHEYDGAGHRDPAAHAADLRRERALLGAGFARRGFTAGDLTTRAAATMRELDVALERPPDPTRLLRWRRLLDASTLTSARVQRLASRWKLSSEDGAPA
jgi:very-short-patch-repair endonuclease